MNEYKQIIHLMGTKISLYLKANDAKRLVDEACDMLRHYEEIFSANSNTSNLAMLKKEAHLAPQKIDSELYELIKIGKEHSTEENSFLNIAIGPLIKLWRIGFKEANVPDDTKIKNVLELLKPENIVLNDEKKTVFFLKKGTEIDLGCIAKGYFADKIMDFFKKNDAISAMIDLGGNVLVFGQSPSNHSTWTVGIQNPFLPRGNMVALIPIQNQSVVTSGIYERVFEINNQKYHHIFDSKTGYPMKSNVASLTIIADKSIDCDIYTTQLFGFDAASIIYKVNQRKDLSAIVITVDGNLAYTKDLAGKITFVR